MSITTDHFNGFETELLEYVKTNVKNKSLLRKVFTFYWSENSKFDFMLEKGDITFKLDKIKKCNSKKEKILIYPQEIGVFPKCKSSEIKDQFDFVKTRIKKQSAKKLINKENSNLFKLLKFASKSKGRNINIQKDLNCLDLDASIQKIESNGDRVNLMIVSPKTYTKLKSIPKFKNQTIEDYNKNIWGRYTYKKRDIDVIVDYEDNMEKNSVYIICENIGKIINTEDFVCLSADEYTHELIKGYIVYSSYKLVLKNYGNFLKLKFNSKEQ